MLNQAEGIVIRTTDYGETNKIITLFTREYGKIGLMARGAKKPRSKLAGAAQPLTYGHYLFTKGKGLGNLYQADPENPFKFIKSDIYKMAYASYIVDLVDKMAAQDARNPYLFELVLEILRDIDEGIHPQVLSFIFEVKILPLLGIDPELDRCARCGDERGPFQFSVSAGGFLCSRCASGDERAISIAPATAKLLRLFKHLDVRRIGRINLKEQTIHEIKKVLDAYYDAYSGLHLKTKAFIEQLETMKPEP
ncbi:DNA repair protein RecO [Caenibacillus caldisaponilyticus]|uniref:DNA repair protein RecO n=1 Tax=Caenibacillus caldisaponilyticus TaxID=1674942 RepID=UPI0009889194|nr:DNA repair protein RecO [Caenibacillus caldisaponilyticus]